MKNCSWMATERFFEGVQHAKNYATFRPRPPEQLTERIVAYLKEKVSPHYILFILAILD
ncbi:Uncharacterized protein APZ42_006542, partial [Daphnia magna]